MWRASPKNAHTHAIIVSLLTVHTPLTHQAVQDEEPEPEPLVKPLPYDPGSLSLNERRTQNAENNYRSAQPRARSILSSLSIGNIAAHTHPRPFRTKNQSQSRS